jgi:ribonuclease-3
MLSAFGLTGHIFPAPLRREGAGRAQQAKKRTAGMHDRLQKAIPHHFGQVKLLVMALTHSSHANEQPEEVEHNERLEFLGDAVLELCISEELYRRFPDMREGHLTAMRSRLVNQESLAALARKIGLDQGIVLGKGEEAQGGRERDSLLSDAFEALLGAVFLDGGYAAARETVRGLFAGQWPASGGRMKNKDNKSRLQEVTQQLYKERPLYSLLGSSGPEHDKLFTVRLELPDNTVFTATGSSVKKAEQTAAHTALLHFFPVEKSGNPGP